MFEQPLERAARLWTTQGRLGHELHAQSVANERTITEAGGELDGGSRVADGLRELLPSPKEGSRKAGEGLSSGEQVVVGFLERLTIELGRCVDVVVVRARECEPDEDARAL